MLPAKVIDRLNDLEAEVKSYIDALERSNADFAREAKEALPYAFKDFRGIVGEWLAGQDIFTQQVKHQINFLNTTTRSVIDEPEIYYNIMVHTFDLYLKENFSYEYIERPVIKNKIEFYMDESIPTGHEQMFFGDAIWSAYLRVEDAVARCMMEKAVEQLKNE